MWSRSKKSKARGLDKTERHKRFHERVIGLGCIVTGDHYNVTLHHIHGAKTQLKNAVGASVHVGEYAVLPLVDYVHLYQLAGIAEMSGEYNLDAHKKQFIEKNGTELELFRKMYDRYQIKFPTCEYIDHVKMKLIIDRGLN